MRAVVPIIALVLCLGVGGAEATGGDSCAAGTDLATIMTTCDGTPFEDAALAMDTATASGGPVGSCFTPSGALENDRWYTWTNTTGSTQQLVVTTDGAPNATNSDSEIAIFDDCSGTTQHACDQDGGSFGSGWLSTVTYDVAAGETIQIVFDGYNGNDTFTSAWFSCAAPPPPPPGDTCAAAIEITSLPYSDTQDTSLTVSDSDPNVGSCNSGSATDTDNDIWYFFETNTACQLEVSVAYTGGYDGLTTVWTGADCGSLVEDTCLDAGATDTTTVNTTPGTVYWVHIGDWGTIGGGGVTDITVTDIGGDCDIVPVELQSFSIE